MISPKENPQEMKAFFEKVLNVKNAPIAKWPSRFMPALMQQVAVNLAICKDENDGVPIFSVNGPPGTGKTTLLKEIIANNIVERAWLLSEYDDSDSAFAELSFSAGKEANHAYNKYAQHYYKLKNDKINDYGIVVTSCNNAAVENITADLPKSSDLLDSLKPDEKKDRQDIKDGLCEVYNLFDPEKMGTEEIPGFEKSKQEKELYFTRYAKALFENEHTWGLVSAPLGRREKIRSYCTRVLQPFDLQYRGKEQRAQNKKEYKEEKARFRKQYAKVEELRKKLEKNCEIEKRVSSNARTDMEKDYGVIDDYFIRKYSSAENEEATSAQVVNPWFTEEYNREREKLFAYALKLNKSFVVSSVRVWQNMKNLLIAWNMSEQSDVQMDSEDKKKAMPVLLQSLFLLTPVISTTFASVQTFFKEVTQSGVFGTLIVDEAGQAPPEMAVGALFRCRKAIIVGDPKQIEPVVTDDADLMKSFLARGMLRSYADKRVSVQGFADYINPYGTCLGEGEEQEWVGCPLVVHRRCISPMYDISNKLSYDGTMKQQTLPPGEEKCKSFILDNSYWIDVEGGKESAASTNKKNHFVEAQGDVVLSLLEKKFAIQEGIPKLFIITPFTSVKESMKEKIRKSKLYQENENVKKWLDGKSIGTVHTFQGQGTDEVIFLLGCDMNSIMAANWVNKNIVNVAVTRAKYRVYIIGDERVWQCKPVSVARGEMEKISVDDLKKKLAKKDEMLSTADAEPESGASTTNLQNSVAGITQDASERRTTNEAEKWYEAGENYYYGVGVEQNDTEAAAWYKKAAEQGHRIAQYRLGMCYEMGQGVDEDLEKTSFWCEKAAEQGYAPAQFYIADMMYMLCKGDEESGHDARTEVEKALKLFRESAEQGYIEAQLALGDIYSENNRNSEQDYAEAAKWYHKAALQGSLTAQYYLGGFYSEGKGVRRDYAKAVKWYRLSAEQGNRYAQYQLGVCYENGTGVERDYGKAREWYRRSAVQGVEEAQKKMAER